MAKMLLIKTNNEAEERDLKDPLHETLQDEIGGFWEIVRPRKAYDLGVFAPGMCFIVDEDGHAKGLEVNPAGCYLYGGTIVGNLLITKETLTRNGADFIDLKEEEIARLVRILKLRMMCKEARRMHMDADTRGEYLVVVDNYLDTLLRIVERDEMSQVTKIRRFESVHKALAILHRLYRDESSQDDLDEIELMKQRLEGRRKL